VTFWGSKRYTTFSSSVTTGYPPYCLHASECRRYQNTLQTFHLTSLPLHCTAAAAAAAAASPPPPGIKATGILFWIIQSHFRINITTANKVFHVSELHDAICSATECYVISSCSVHNTKTHHLHSSWARSPTLKNNINFCYLETGLKKMFRPMRHEECGKWRALQPSSVTFYCCC